MIVSRRIALMLLVACIVGTGGCNPSVSHKTKLVVWGPQFLDRMQGRDAAIEEMNAGIHPSK